MKKSLVLINILALTLTSSAQQNPLQKIQWLTGSWKGVHNGKPFYEAWRKLNDTTLLNFTIEIKGIDTLVREHGIVRITAGGGFYKNRGGEWKMLSLNDTAILFGNDTLKFANKITWSRTKHDHWLTTINNPNGIVRYDIERATWLDRNVDHYISNLKAGQTSSKPSITIKRDITVVCKDGEKLAATLIKPKMNGKTPLIILLHGSGNDTRQNEYYDILSHKFTDIGFSVLVYDKRGSGQSSGNWIESPFSTLKDDVLSIIELVKEDSSIGKIGLWGGSEGSCIALWAAAESDLVSFIIAQSFTATSFADQNRYQTRLSTQSIVNNNKELIKARMKVQELVYNYARTGKGYDKYVESVNALRRNPWFTQILGEAMRRDDKWWSWYKTKMDIKPIAFLKKVNAPVLFIWGELDKLVPVEQSYRLVIAQAKGKKIKTIIFKGANHSLYNNTAEPVHLKVMQDWLIRIRDSLIATNT